VSAAPADLTRGRHVVVTAGDPELLAQMVGALRAARYRVFQAYDGTAVYMLAVTLPTIDLLITDTRMPGRQGPALIRRLRDLLPSLAVLHVATAGPPDPDAEGRIPADAPVLREPFTTGQLLAAVRPLLPAPA